jgi:hypothetical protein
MGHINEIMFRTALQAGIQNPDGIVLSDEKGNPVTNPTAQNIDATQSLTQNVFQTHFPYMIIALVVMGTGILSVLPIFAGFWRLGRDMSFNPIEVAKEFDAAALVGQPGSSYKDIKGLVKEIGKR